MMESAHVPVLAQEAVAALTIKPDGVYVDATFGRGGHSRLILDRLGAQGRLIALDRDPDAIRAGAILQDARLTLVHSAFSRLAAVLDELDVKRVDGMLLDIGVSSPQLDDATGDEPVILPGVQRLLQLTRTLAGRQRHNTVT